MILFILFCFGAIIGSFLNVVILRMPHEETLNGRSHCMHCGHELSSLELFPIFSFLFLRGKCKNCKAPISPRYAIIETITGLLFLLGYIVFKPHDAVSVVAYLQYLYLACISVVVFVIDLEHFLILDKIVFPSILVGLLFAVGHSVLKHQIFTFTGPLITAVLGLVVGTLPFFAVWYFSEGKWLGFGDVKLLLFLGLMNGCPLIFVTIMVAVFAGGLVSAGLLLVSKKTMQSKIPFGTFLVFGSVVTMLWGPILLHWYLALLGIS